MFRVTDKPINLQELVDFVSDPEAGAVATFIGTTRSNNEGRNVIALDYEAYPEMAEKELRRIGEEAAKRWQICQNGYRASHRPVQISQASVMIAVSSAHREAAFAASRFAIEEIKRIVPIWKKEMLRRRRSVDRHADGAAFRETLRRYVKSVQGSTFKVGSVRFVSKWQPEELTGRSNFNRLEINFYRGSPIDRPSLSLNLEPLNFERAT